MSELCKGWDMNEELGPPNNKPDTTENMYEYISDKHLQEIIAEFEQRKLDCETKLAKLALEVERRKSHGE